MSEAAGVTTLCVADLMTLEPIVVRDTDSVAFAEMVLRDFHITPDCRWSTKAVG